MPPPTTRVFCVLGLVAFVAGFATLGAHMLLQGLLLEHELTYVVYGMAGAGMVGAVFAIQAARSSDGGRAPKAAIGTFALNALLMAATFFSTTVLVALPPVTVGWVEPIRKTLSFVATVIAVLTVMELPPTPVTCRMLSADRLT